MQATTTRSVTSSQLETDQGYTDLEQQIAAAIAGNAAPLFTTDAEGLFTLYLESIPAENRQYYSCHCCRRFIENYGSLVTINEIGIATPLLWGDAIGTFAGVALKLHKTVEKSRVNGVFLSSDPVWGNPKTGEWTHLCGVNPKVFKSTALKSAGQAMAEKKEDYAMLSRGLADFGVEVVEQAVRVLKADALTRGEKTLGIAEWLLKLHRSIEASGKNRKCKENLVWLAVATAPPGFCHVRSTMISTLLEDLADRMDFKAVQKRWADKMHPLQYQRPTAIKTGAIEKAEKIVAALDTSGALRRRFAKISEVLAFWRPKAAEPATECKDGGVFDHLRKAAGGKSPLKAVELPTQTMTWEKFARTILPSALTLELHLEAFARYPFCPLVTAVDPNAQSILQWDTEPRNPVSWYFYHGGKTASEFGLSGGWHKVAALCQSPAHWHHPEKFKHHSENLHLLLEGCKDVNYKRGALFFPECLRTEYHEIRQVMELHSQLSSIERDGADDEACGIAVHQKAQGWNLNLRVTAADGVSLFKIDRWD